MMPSERENTLRTYAAIKKIPMDSLMQVRGRTDACIGAKTDATELWPNCEAKGSHAVSHKNKAAAAVGVVTVI